LHDCPYLVRIHDGGRFEGRLFNVAEAPLCDFSADEAFVLVDKQLSDPLVHLRLKQSRVATIALFPGVNVAVPFADQVVDTPRQAERSRTDQTLIGTDAAWAVVAEALAPYLIPRLREALDQATESGDRSSKSGRWSRKGSQRKLL
jgi:hypothetical protein